MGKGSEVEVRGAPILPDYADSTGFCHFRRFWSFVGHFSALFSLLVPFPFELWDRGF